MAARNLLREIITRIKRESRSWYSKLLKEGEELREFFHKIRTGWRRPADVKINLKNPSSEDSARVSKISYSEFGLFRKQKKA